MHEFSVTERLFQLALEQANLEIGERIERLHIELTSESGYAPDAIRFYFEQLAVGTPASGAELCFREGNHAEHIKLTAIDIDDSSPPAGANLPLPIEEPQPAQSEQLARWSINISGLVHNAEFPPFVSALAEENHLSGWIINTPTGVTIEVQGLLPHLEHFCHHLQHDAPSLTRILNVAFDSVDLLSADGFEIR